MADIREKITFDDSAVIKGLQNQYDLITSVDKALRSTEVSYKEAFDIASKQLEKSNKATTDATGKITSHIIETNKAKHATGGWGDALHGVADEINIMGTNLGGVVSNLKSKAAALKNVTSAIGGTVRGMGVLKIAIAATGIGLLVVALAAVVSFMGKSATAADKFGATMKGVSAGASFLGTRLANATDALLKFISLDFKGAAESWAAATNNFADALKETGRWTRQLALERMELDRLASEETVTNAKIKGQVAGLLLQAADRNTALSTRIGLLEQVKTLEVDSAERDFRLNQKLFLNENLRLALIEKERELTSEEIRNLNALKVAAINAGNARQEVAITTTSRISGLIKQENALSSAAHQAELARIKALNEALQSQIEKITEAADKIANEALDPESRLRAEANLATLIIEEQFRILDQRAKAAGKEVDLSQDRAYLLLAIEKHLARDIENVRGESIAKLGESVIKPLQVTERKAVDIVGNVQDALIRMGDSPEVKGSMLTLNENLQKAFGLNEDELASIGNSISSIYASMQQGTADAIEKNNELLDSLQQTREQADDDLEKEIERREAGLANNVVGKKKEIEEIKKQEAIAQKEAEKLRKKAIAQQLIADAVAQASNLATMISNVVASPGVSLLGPAGIPIAIATIAAFIGILAKVKTSQKKLSGGGSLDQDGVTGFVNLGGRTDKSGGRGHRVEDSNVVLGGREFIVGEGPANEHRELLESINSGRFTGKEGLKEGGQRGLHFALGYNGEHDHDSAIIMAASARNKERMIVEGIDRAFEKHANRMIAAIEEKPDTTAYEPGMILRERTKSGVKITETVKDWRWKPERN